MLGEEGKNRPPLGNRKTYSRSVSWTGGSPTQSSSSSARPQWNSKARACLPPLQPLSIARPNVEEWPKPGSDDLGIWANPATPGPRPPRPITTCDDSRRVKPLKEFEFQKDKLAFFNKECSRIVDHIYLGSDTVAKNREVLRQNGITHVLNCVGFLCAEYFKNDLVYKTLWLQDSPSEDITSILYDVFDYFEDVREQGGRVFVHCCQGVSRSTSLVIAYLMWKEGQSFEDAFQYVKAARGVTNPNMGFACQLLQCQKRVHALPASPSSVLRMYRLAPHSPYDPLHLVPKMISEPGAKGLDSRGAFIVHVPSAIYVWIGKYCMSVMLETARAAAYQVIRYERAQGPILIIKEEEEPAEFWYALGIEGKVETDEDSDGVTLGQTAVYPLGDGRKVCNYDLDYEIFHKALAGGVVPPFPLSETGSETCLPARINGWSRLRRKFASGIMKEFITSSKLSCTSTETSQQQGNANGSEDADPFSPSSPPCNSPVSYAPSSPNWMKDTCKGEDLTDHTLSRSPSFGSLDSFPTSYVTKAKSNTTSPSLSPSTSEYSSSFTFSPSSSNWSDVSHLSAQPSPSGLESKGLNATKDESLEESAPLLHEGTSPSAEDTFSTSHTSWGPSTCLPCRGRSPSLAERRGNIPPPRMMLPSVDDDSQVSVSLLRSWSFSIPDLEDELMKEIDYNELSGERSFDKSREEIMVDADMLVTEDGVPCSTHNYVLYQWPSMEKVEMPCGILDSRSTYIIFVPHKNSGSDSADILYVWVGRYVSSKGNLLISDNGTIEDGCIQWETIGRNFINQNGLATSSLVQVVREGEEPEQLLMHLPVFSFQKVLDTGVK